MLEFHQGEVGADMNGSNWVETLRTPLGVLQITATQQGVSDVDWVDDNQVSLKAVQSSVQDTGLNAVHDARVENEGDAVQLDAWPSRELPSYQSQSSQTEHLHMNSQEAKRWAQKAVQQLNEYFSGQLSEFDLKLDIHGTHFQKSVWRALARIPYGETRSYKDIALSIGNPAAVRAVGQANRRNPVAVIVPCHRVIGAGGQLVGYAGSQTHLKAGLLELERQNECAATVETGQRPSAITGSLLLD